jgi:hypothetical protein
VSLIVTSDKGERTTDPGVMLGSSSTLLIWVPWNMNQKCKQDLYKKYFPSFETIFCKYIYHVHM